ncbi:MAG: transposase [Lentisphaeria bacterium]
MAEKSHHILTFEETIKQFQRKVFGLSSEKPSSEQLGLFNEVEALECSEEQDDSPAAIDVKPHQRVKRPRVSIPKDYPREDIIHDLLESDKVCPHDGTTLERVGSEDHEQLDVVPAQINVLRHRRLKYACLCGRQHIVTARKPSLPIEKSISSPGLLAFVATQKYYDALPLSRQSEIFKRIRIEIGRTNLSNWMIKAGALIQPLINLLLDKILERSVVHMDETTLQVLNEPDKPAQSKRYMWLMASFTEQPITVFNYEATRKGTIPCAMLDKSVSALMVDGYEGYQSACNQHDIVRLGCWAHTRRKFVDAQKLQVKGKVGKADQAIAFIQGLYRIEKQTKALSESARYAPRKTQAIPIINKMAKWLENSLLHAPPKTVLGKALGYLKNQWPGLIRYLEDGSYPIDNNLEENEIRPFTVGRNYAHNLIMCT